MPVSEYILVPIETISASDRMSPENWDGWWADKRPRFEYDDIVLDRLICSLTPARGDILEAGCGLGRWVELLRNKGYSCTGVETSEAAIGRALHLFPKCKFLKCDIVNLHFAPNDSIDTYLSWGVLEHFREGPEKPLAEALRALRPGGILIATIPNYSVYRRLTRPFSALRDYLKSKPLIQRIAGKPPSQSTWFEYQYTSTEFTRVLSASGFLPLNNIPLFIRHGVRMASRFFGAAPTSIALNYCGALVESLTKKHCPAFFAHMNLFIAMKAYGKSACKDYTDLNNISLLR